MLLELVVEWYEVEVASDGASGLIKARSKPEPDLIVLDWNLPDFSGVDICQRIRSSGVTTPILMLTGHDDIADRVKALDAGVDDYLVKPFSIEELMARLRAMQRRASGFSGSGQGNDAESTFLAVGGLTINTQTRDVHRSGQRIQLSVKEYELLCFLMRGSGKVLERSEIRKGVWEEDFYGEDNLLDVYIRYLRQKVESESSLS